MNTLFYDTMRRILRRTLRDIVLSDKRINLYKLSSFGINLFYFFFLFLFDEYIEAGLLLVKLYNIIVFNVFMPQDL